MVRGAAEQAGSMEEFKQGSDEIENIIRTIDNIAFQTNILVLNTAVEATINRITLCFCPAGDCVLAGLPCQLVELHQFLPSPPTVFGRISQTSLPLPTQRRLPSRMLMGMSRGSPPYPISTPHHLAPPLLCRSAWGFQWDHKSSSDNVSVARSSPYMARPHIRFDASLESMWTAEDGSARPAAGSR